MCLLSQCAKVSVGLRAARWLFVYCVYRIWDQSSVFVAQTTKRTENQRICVSVSEYGREHGYMFEISLLRSEAEIAKQNS